VETTILTLGAHMKTIRIIKGFEEEEIRNFEKDMLGDADGYSDDTTFYEQMSNDSRYIEFTGEPTEEYEERLEKYLKELGIPFICYECEDTGEMTVFDGVREHAMICTKDKTPLVEMNSIREIIDLLEKSEEEDPYADMRALVKANENWIETDINNMWRYGMENSVAFSHNYREDSEDIIDTTIEEENGGTPEITKKVNS